MKVDISGFDNAFAAFEATAKAYPDKSFLAIPAKADRDYFPAGVEFTYSQAHAQIPRTCGDLYQRSGVRPTWPSADSPCCWATGRKSIFFHLFALNSGWAQAWCR